MSLLKENATKEHLLGTINCIMKTLMTFPAVIVVLKE